MKVLVIIHFAGILDGRKPVQKAGCVTYYAETLSVHKQMQHWINRRRTGCWSRKLGTREGVKTKKLSLDKVKSYESSFSENKSLILGMTSAKITSASVKK